MKRLAILGVLGMLAVAMAGCGGGGDTVSFFADVTSTQSLDGDVGKFGGTYTISSAGATGNVLFGLDASGTEFRAFLDFPLDGSTRQAVVPADAAILSATLDVFVNQVSFAATVPTLADLVVFPVTGTSLSSADYGSAVLASRSLNFLSSDAGKFVRIDVTDLMREAQRRRLNSFQVRLLLDFVPGADGLVEIDDGSVSRAPLLTVEYL